VFPAARGGYIDLHNLRAREWIPAIRASGLEPRRRIYDCRHTYATMSLAAGVSLFTLSRRMGTSVDMIDRTYGHPAPDAEAVELALLNAYDVDLLEFELPKDRNSGGRSRPATSSAWPGRTA
jgi:integrase